MTQPQIDTKQMQKNIKHSKELRNQSLQYNGVAALTAITAISAYFGTAITIEEQDKVATIALLMIGIANNIAAIYALFQSNKKSRQAMEILKQNTKVK